MCSCLDTAATIDGWRQADTDMADLQWQGDAGPVASLSHLLGTELPELLISFSHNTVLFLLVNMFLFNKL